MSELSLDDTSTLYLTLQGAYLKTKDGRIQVYHEEKLVGQVLLKDIQRICVFGQILLSNQLVTTCLDRDIIIFHFTKYGRYRGSTFGGEVKSYHVQEAQLKVNDSTALQFTRELISSQMTSRVAILRRKQERVGEKTISEILKLRDRVKTAPTIDSLRGLEGMASKIYWGVFGSLLSDPSLFNGRSRRPPKDESNALLSFTYTLLGTEVETHVRYYGLNPYKGYLHEYRYGRKSLQLDLIEQFRPAAETFCISLLNQKKLTTKHFEREGVSVLLDEKGRKIFLREYEDFLKKRYRTDHGSLSLRHIAQIQVQKLVTTITEKKPYTGFSFKR